MNARSLASVLIVAACLIIAASLSACASPGKPEIQYQRVSVPVAVSCVPETAPTVPKVHTAAELRAMAPANRYLAIAADRLSLLAYEVEASAVIEACR